MNYYHYRTLSTPKTACCALLQEAAAGEDKQIDRSATIVGSVRSIVLMIVIVKYEVSALQCANEHV